MKIEFLDATPLGENFTFADLHGLTERYFASLDEAPKPHFDVDPKFILMTKEQLARYDSMLFWGRGEGDPVYRGLPIKVLEAMKK